MVLTGEVQICLRVAEDDLSKGLPALLPIGRLKENDTFGESACGLPAGVSFRSGSGASLLCWKRDAVLEGLLAQLVGDSINASSRPALLEQCWSARTPLSLLVEEPRLLALLEPMTHRELRERYGTTHEPTAGASGHSVRNAEE